MMQTEYQEICMIPEMYDETKDAMQSGNGYLTKLDPPPADERVAHPTRMDAEGSK
jgi:hypothetical protein